MQLYDLTCVIHSHSQVKVAQIIAAPKKKKIIKIVFYTMENGHAMADLPRLMKHLRIVDTPDLSEMHTSYDNAWVWVERILAVLLGEIWQIIKITLFFGLSVDLPKAMGHIDYE